VNENNRYHEIFDNMADPCYIVDAHMQIVDLNKSFEKFCGSDKKQLIGKACHEILKCNIMDRCPLTNAIKSSTMSTGYEMKVFAKGEEKVVLGNCIPLEDIDGKCSTGVFILHDITNLKKAEFELLKAQTLKTRAILASGIAHEHHKLLVGISENISHAKRLQDSNHEIIKLLDRAEDSVNKAKSLSTRIVGLTKEEQPVKTIDINQLLVNTTSLVIKESNIKVIFNLADEIWSLLADENQIIQVITSLFLNAKKTTKADGQIDIHTENINLKAMDIENLEDGNYIKVTIKDNGIGIPPEDLKNIYDIFITTRESSIGFGFPAALSIVKSLGGTIQIDSKQGNGTEACVYFPANISPKDQSEKEKETKISDRTRILIMDDEEIVRVVSRDIIDYLGYDSDFATNGFEAVKKYSKGIEENRPFAAVILDLIIPGGMGGVEAIKTLKSIDPDVRAILMSGYSEDPVMSSYEEHGFRWAIKKPFKIVDLQNALEFVLDKSKI
jgi:two-component system, cell cycle sensor histidine kinase and response regulator CckA